MTKINQENDEYSLLKQDEEIEWWRPTKQDNFSLTKKLMRTGCRPLKRKYLRCLRNDEGTQHNECEV